MGVQNARTRLSAAPSSECPAPDWGSGRGALHRGRPPQPGVDKALGSGATRGPSWPDSGDEGVPRAGRRGAALTWMVQVYSLSSSSRTVQLYSRSRLLLLPLINLLSIFPPARPPPGETRRRCGPRTRRPSARQLRTGPKHLHHHPSADTAAASC